MSVSNLACLAVGTVLAVVYLLVCAAATKKYQQLLAPLDDKEHFFKAVYPLGFLVCDLVPFIMKTSIAHERAHACEVIYGSVYKEFYFRLNYAQKVSVVLFMVPFALLLVPLLGGAGVVLGLLAAVCGWWYYDMKLTDEMDVRADEIAQGLPDVLSKLALLVSAGMVMKEAWERVGGTGTTTIYREMQKATQDMQNSGMSETEAIIGFGVRCGSPEAKKFATTLAQNLSKGNRELADFLMKQSSASWAEKREYAKQKGEAASSKLMIPIAGMMIGVMVMVVVPIFSNLGL